MPPRRTAPRDLTSLAPDPLAWAQAVAIVEETDGDRRRIEMLDQQTLIVRNRPVR